MITPLMLVLSSLNEKYETDSPVDILYLSRTDRDLILSEAARLCDRVLDENIIAVYEGRVFPTQYCGGDAITLNIYTAALLERLIKCAKVYKASSTGVAVDDDQSSDLSAQSTVLRLEGNPDHIYYYVYKLMNAATPTYDMKIQKLTELLLTLHTHSGDRFGMPSEDPKLHSRMELHSQLSYWKTMLVGDVMRQALGLPEEPFTESTVDVIRSQLKTLGFYGFVNPLQMYKDFSNSRVSRKAAVNIPDKVLIFLGKIIQSGGGRVQLEDNY